MVPQQGGRCYPPGEQFVSHPSHLVGPRPMQTHLNEEDLPGAQARALSMGTNDRCSQTMTSIRRENRKHSAPQARYPRD